MKLSIWDVLTGILLLAILLVGGLVMSVFANPYTAINPFPPQKLPPTVVIPTSTPTFRAMPATWTPNAETVQAYAALGYTLVPTDTAGPSPTGFTLTFTDTPQDTETPTPTETLTPWASSTTYVYNYPTTKATTCSGCATSVPSTKVPTTPPGISSASEISGVKTNVWQKQTNNPVFLMPVSPGAYAFYYYWGLDPNGEQPFSNATPVGTGTPTDTPTSTLVVPDNYIPIAHDAKSIDFTPPPVPACGAFYLRIQTYVAFKSGSGLSYSISDWKTVFIFKYDPTPPNPVYYAPSGITGALRGVQNISGNPHFTLNTMNGGGAPVGSIIPSGDYRDYGPNSDGVDENQIYPCSGVKGYYIYWGTDPTGIDNTHYITSTTYSPPGLGSKNTNRPYFLRVDSVDQLGNHSGWWTVALDDSYVYDPSTPPTLEQSAFYYDTVKPNNITSITENNYNYTSDSAFTNQNQPDFTFSGGDDPGGFNPNNPSDTDPPPWGYDVVWSTSQNSTSSVFQNSPGFAPTLHTSGTYYLKVRDVDWAMNRPTDWKTFVYKFDNVGPTGVTKVTESNGVKYNVFQNTNDTPSFSWEVSKITDPGTLTTSSGLAQPITYFIYWGTDRAGIPSNPQTGNTFDPGSVTTGVYYLRIMLVDNAGNQTITNPFIMKYDDTAPDAPIVDEHDIPHNPPNHPTFTWASHDVGSGIAGYYYYYGTNPSGTSNTLTKTTSLDGKVHSGATYYLWVEAKDNAGNTSAPYTTSFTYP